jgi:hypothetical protein
MRSLSSSRRVLSALSLIASGLRSAERDSGARDWSVGHKMDLRPETGKKAHRVTIIGVDDNPVSLPRLRRAILFQRSVRSSGCEAMCRCLAGELTDVGAIC